MKEDLSIIAEIALWFSTALFLPLVAAIFNYERGWINIQLAQEDAGRATTIFLTTFFFLMIETLLISTSKMTLDFIDDRYIKRR